VKLEGDMKLDRITIDPTKMNGQPCVRNMRLTVKRVVELAALYPNREEMFREYPELEDEDIRQALTYVATYLDDRILELPVNHETAA
jgi:uncharacterized protein (DUF433 family)